MTITPNDTVQPARNRGRHRRRLLGLTLLLAASGVGATTAAAQAGAFSPAPRTPNQCIAANHGDNNACNVGNSGRGDLGDRPMSSTAYSPNECIRRNGGDWNACNVGNSGRGDRAYQLVP
jgi:hypothetical protein